MTRKRNLSQKFEKLLNGRSILELTDEETVMATDLLAKIVNNKSLRSLTEVELQALIESIAVRIAFIIFNGHLPDDWKKQTAYWLENSYEEWIWDYVSIDLYIEVLDIPYTDERRVLRATIIKYLNNHRDYYVYFRYFMEAIYGR